MRCSVPSCGNRDSSISYHEFPSNSKKFNLWIKSITLGENLEDLFKPPTERSRICALHFDPSDFRHNSCGRRILKNDAIPKVRQFEEDIHPVELSPVLASDATNNSNEMEQEIQNENEYLKMKNKELTEELTVLCKQHESQIELLNNQLKNRSKNDAAVQVNVQTSQMKQVERENAYLLKQNQKVNEKMRDLQCFVDRFKIISKRIEKIQEDASNNESKAIFILDQIHNYTLKSPRWSEMTIRMCVAWRFSSPKGYELGRRYLIHAPCRSTLDKYVASPDNGFGVTDLINKRLKTEATNLQHPEERLVSIILDEMAIKERMFYSRSEDKFYGLENAAKDDCIIGTNAHLANKLLCFVIHGFSTKYTIPVAYYFTRSITGKRLHEITLNILQNVSKCGFTIIRIVADNHKSNVALFRYFGSGSLRTSIPHPIIGGLPLFMSFDHCHCIKNARSLYLDHDMSDGEGIITSTYIKNIYEIQKDMLIKPIKFLTKKHIQPNSFEKMNVLRAIQIFSPALTNLLIYLKHNKNSQYNFSNAGATIKFMQMMHRFFKIHDVSDRLQHIHQLDPDTAPYKALSDERLDWLENDFPLYIQTIQDASKRLNMKGLSTETAEALMFTSRSSYQCISFLLNSGFYYVLTRRFSSDPIEAFFSSVRLRGGFNDMTDARAAHSAIKKIIQTGIILSSKDANISNEDPSQWTQQSKRSGITDTHTPVCENNTEINLILQEMPNSEILIRNIFSPCLSNIEENCESASVAWIAGYLVRTIQERIGSCIECLTDISSPATSNKLLDLIYLHDKGSLKYPSKPFVRLISAIIQFIVNLLPFLRVYSSPLSIITKILQNPVSESNCFTCDEHKLIVADIILEKLGKPVLQNIGNQITQKSNVLKKKLYSKPLSRKILKL